ncbi:MAG: metal ABC transporter ATP-binding protein [Chloroflexi bacterium]|nr:metal ABC transporter ATP-binding protein [Chloroflexota bacterium]
MSTAPPIIELRHVSVAYGTVKVLDDVNLTVPEGAFLAIIGPNGAGKTTLVRTILGLVKPIEGEVLVFGKPPKELGPLRREIGYVPQMHTVDLKFPVRVRDVVMMGRYARLGLFRRPGKADHEAVERAMAKVDIQDLADRPLSDLSGGQRQRVFLARALATEPRLLILDEPTAGVDAQTSTSLYELLRSFQQEGMTVLMVSHDVGVVSQYVDGVACVNRRLVAHGRPEVVLTDDTLAEMYGCQAMFFHHGHVPHMVVRAGEEKK